MEDPARHLNVDTKYVIKITPYIKLWTPLGNLSRENNKKKMR